MELNGIYIYDIIAGIYIYIYDITMNNRCVMIGIFIGVTEHIMLHPPTFAIKHFMQLTR